MGLTGSDIGLSLLADVGGTHARFVLKRGAAWEALATLNCADYRSLDEAVLAYLRSRQVSRVDAAAFALAGPIKGGQMRMTNLDWTVTTNALAQACGIGASPEAQARVKLLNDYEALALALPHLPPTELLHLGGSTSLQEGNLAVVGPGTGLGAGALVRNARGEHAVVGEGGHMTASPGDAREWHIIEHCHSMGYAHVSWERLISGTGLPELHRAVCAVDGHDYQPLSAEQIGKQAQAGADPGCVASIHTFTSMLGSFAGDMALAIGATGGVFIAGGIVPKLGAAFSAELFRRRFVQKGRFESYLSSIGCFVIESAHPAFYGLASAVEHDARRSSSH